MFKKNGFYVLVFLLISACASHDDVRPSLDGTHEVLISGVDYQDTSREAIRQAKSYCQSQSKEMFVIDEVRHFESSLTQTQYEQAKRLLELGEAAKGVLSSVGGTEIAGATSAVSILSDSYAGTLEENPYVTSLTFECH